MLINLDTGYFNGRNVARALSIIYDDMQAASDIENEIIHNLPPVFRDPLVVHMKGVVERYWKRPDFSARKKDALLRYFLYTVFANQKITLQDLTNLEQGQEDSQKKPPSRMLTKKNVV